MTEPPQPSETPPPDGATILVVEDDLPLARLMEALLESAGYHVVSVGDGEAALSSLRADRPALVLLDLTLPRLDGWEVLERLREDLEAPPVILFTGHRAATERAIAAGAAAAVLKPFDVDDLLATVERLLVSEPA